MNDLNDIFNLSLDDFKEEKKKSYSTFKPEANSGKDGVYKAVVKFVPWHKDVKKSIMKKWSTWMVNPADNSGKSVDCPSTIGKKSIIQDLYWKFKKSDSVAEQKLAENFSRREKYASLVQIVKDDNNPDNVGKIMVWSYGSKIYNKLQAELKPEYGKPHNPFDLFESKPFIVHVTKVAGYNNYDNCKFAEERTAIVIDGDTMSKTQKDMEIIKNYLNESPDLSLYDYQEWTAETEAFVNDVIANVVPSGRIQSELETSNRTAKTNTAAATKKEAAPPVVAKPGKKEDDFNFDDEFDSNFDTELYDSL
jgi:hypothetical protein